MALSLLADYSSGSDSSDSDDGISVIINKDEAKKNGQNCRQNGAQDRKRQRPPPTLTKKAKLAALAPKSESVLNSSVLRPDDEIIPSRGESQAKSIPLPTTLLTMFDKADDTPNDNPALHGGRIRAFPHEKNNWASFVYIDASDIELEEARNFVCKEFDLEPCTDSLHLSVSRTHSLRHHWISPLMQSLTQSLKEIERFSLKLDRLKVYRNDERTRTFVGLEATVGTRQLNRITQAVDKVLKEYNLPPFYSPPSFHVSLGWRLGDNLEEISKYITGVEMRLLDVIEDEETFGKLFVRTVVCKSGNKFFDFQLK